MCLWGKAQRGWAKDTVNAIRLCVCMRVWQVSAAGQYVLVLLSNGTLLSYGECHSLRHARAGGVKSGRGRRALSNVSRQTVSLFGIMTYEWAMTSENVFLFSARGRKPDLTVVSRVSGLSLSNVFSL